MPTDPDRSSQACEGSSDAAGRSGRTAERSGAGAAAPPPLTRAEALAELMPGLFAGETANAGAPAAASAAAVKGGTVSFFNSAFAVFLIALIVRLAFAWSGLTAPDEQRFVRPDSAGYLMPAKSMLQTGEYCGPDGEITAHRTPGLPVLFSFLMAFSSTPEASIDTVPLSVVLLILGALTAVPVYWACRYFSGRTPSAVAALLFALNPTAIAHAPLLLSDTFFSFFAAFVLFFFISFAFGAKKDPFYFFAAVLAGALAALVRPVNLFFFLPLIAALFLVPSLSLKRKTCYAAITCLIFFVILFPWIARNHAIGSGWRLDASSATTMMHNASAVESVVLYKDGASLREQYEAAFKREYNSDPLHYETAGARMDHVESEMAAKLFAHPFVTLYLTFRPWVFLPDVPTLLENQGVTQSERGTFDVLNREGIFAAVKHYFAGNGKALAATLPLLAVVFLLYLTAIIGWFLCVKKKQWLTAFLLLGFGLYYTLMTGPVQMPRYQLPALPVLCLFSAIALEAWRTRREKA